MIDDFLDDLGYGLENGLRLLGVLWLARGLGLDQLWAPRRARYYRDLAERAAGVGINPGTVAQLHHIADRYERRRR